MKFADEQKKKKTGSNSSIIKCDEKFLCMHKIISRTVATNEVFQYTAINCIEWLDNVYNESRDHSKSTKRWRIKQLNNNTHEKKSAGNQWILEKLLMQLNDTW